MSKQYIMVLNDQSMALLKAILSPGTAEFLEIQGLNLNAENKHHILVTPVVPPITPAVFAPSLPPSPGNTGDVDDHTLQTDSD